MEPLHDHHLHAHRNRLRASDSGDHQAFLLLRTVFTIAPIAFGLDKFFEVMTDWDKYLAPWINDLVPGDAHQAMLLVGVIEIVAGLLVAVRPAIGGYVVALWLAGIIVNLLSVGGYADVPCATSGCSSAPSPWPASAVSPAARR